MKALQLVRHGKSQYSEPHTRKLPSHWGELTELAPGSARWLRVSMHCLFVAVSARQYRPRNLNSGTLSWYSSALHCRTSRLVVGPSLVLGLYRHYLFHRVSFNRKTLPHRLLPQTTLVSTTTILRKQNSRQFRQTFGPTIIRTGPSTMTAFSYDPTNSNAKVIDVTDLHSMGFGTVHSTLLRINKIEVCLAQTHIIYAVGPGGVTNDPGPLF